MIRPYEFCPKCQGIRKTSLSIGMRRRITEASFEISGLLLHIHCASCNAYICSYLMTEEAEEPAYIEVSQEVMALAV